MPRRPMMTNGVFRHKMFHVAKLVQSQWKDTNRRKFKKAGNWLFNLLQLRLSLSIYLLIILTIKH